MTDLGTEFGVEVNQDGETTSHVFRGSVEVQVVAADGKAEGVAQVLHQNQSARVEKDSGKQGGGNRVTMFVTPAKPANFVREIPKRIIKALDLVDVVAGGDGFGEARGRGIDPTTGKITSTQTDQKRSASGRLPSDGRYHRVDATPLVDGVFIPQGGTIPAQLDSAGHVFAGFPSTDGFSYGCIWAGGVIPHHSDDGVNHGEIFATLGFVDYAEPGHSVLGMHANKGITFDLAAIRRANPQSRITRFVAVAGNSAPPEESSKSDVWVLVDGQVRFHREGMIGQRLAKINVTLDDQSRFLSLVSTDGGDTCSMDWVMFGDPQLIMTTTLLAP